MPCMYEPDNMDWHHALSHLPLRRDDYQRRPVGDLSFRSAVRGVRLRRDRIVAILESKIYVYQFSDLKLLQQARVWETRL